MSAKRSQTAVFSTAIAGLIWSVSSQAPLEMSVVQVRQPLFVRLSDGSVQNSYELRLDNKTDEPMQLAIMMSGLAGADLDLGKLASVRLEPQRTLRVLARDRWQPRHRAKGTRSFSFNVIPQHKQEIGMVSAPATFYMPGSEG